MALSKVFDFNPDGDDAIQKCSAKPAREESEFTNNQKILASLNDENSEENSHGSDTSNTDTASFSGSEEVGENRREKTPATLDKHMFLNKKESIPEDSVGTSIYNVFDYSMTSVACNNPIEDFTQGCPAPSQE